MDNPRKALCLSGPFKSFTAATPREVACHVTTRAQGDCMRTSGHVTGYFPGGSREGLERARQTQCFSRIIHLAKLNPKCHMNYSIIFTDISFSPETSILVNINYNNK